jgi:hypothetical protein
VKRWIYAAWPRFEERGSYRWYLVGSTLIRRGIRVVVVVGILLAFVLQPRGHLAQIPRTGVVITTATTDPHHR